MKAVWFSRHNPTPEQIQNASEMGFEIVGIEEGKIAGAMEIKNDYSRNEVVDKIGEMIKKYSPSAIFGVPSTPIISIMYHNMRPAFTQAFVVYPFYAAWNIQRSIEGQKPTFSHYSWEKIGEMYFYI